MPPFDFAESVDAEGFLRTSAALAQMGARDLAEAVLWREVERLPELPDVACRVLEAAARAGEGALVERLADGLVRRFAGSALAWVIAQRVLRQVGRLAAAARLGDAGVAAMAGDIAVLVERAGTAELARDLAGVKTFCGRVRAVYPRHADALTIELRASRAAGDLAHVDALVAEARALGVEAPGVLVEVLAAAGRTGDAGLLGEVSERLIASAPLVVEGYLAPLYRFLQAGDFAAAERMLARVPAELAGRAEIDRIAVLLLLAQERLEAAYARSMEATARHPGDAELQGLRAAVVRAARDADAVAAHVNAMQPRFPAELRLATEYARLAEDKGDLAEALARWAGFRALAPEQPEGHAHHVRLLMLLERFDEAEREAEAALARFGEDLSVRMQHAIIANVRMDWEAANRRWTEFEARYPDHAEVREWISEARAMRALWRLEGGPSAGLPMAELFMRFESIGSHCEFGLVQRHFGAEPLGLLRWASPAVEPLARMLENGLAGVGAPENVLLRVEPNGEYTAGDTRYFAGHTFVRAATTPQEQMRRTLERRLGFLRDKLLADLAEGEKIFVYLASSGQLTRAAMDRLHRAIRRHGEGVLFCVREGPDVTRHGAVRRLGHRFYLGDIRAPADEGQAPKRHAQTWAAMCAKVVQPAGLR